MGECIECRKNLGILEGYRHPVKGKDFLLCRKCFDTIFESIEEYQEFVSPYIGYFNKEPSTIDNVQKVTENITKNIKKIQNRVNNLWSNKTNQNTEEFFSPIH
jgi:hypothetical protein